MSIRMKTIMELYELAREKYPMKPDCFFEGEIIDGNENERHAYVRGFEDGVKYALENMKEGLDNE